MAPKKRLSDLLREEVKKPAEAETPPAAEAETGRKGSRSTGTAKNGGRQKAQAAKPTGFVSSSKASPEPDAESESDPMAPDPIAADPTAQLKADLEQAKNQETELKQQITRLETELKEQAGSTQQLQTQLQQVEAHTHQLETELSEAKHTVLQLVEVNTQLKQDLESFKARSLTQPAASPPPAKPLQEETKPARSAHPSPPVLSQQEILRRQQESLAHPVFPAGPAPGHLSERDLGWVD